MTHNDAQSVYEYYRFCPRCGSALRVEKEHGKQLLVCEKNDFTFYQNPHSATAAIVRNNEGKIMLVKRAFDPAKGMWDVPGGFMDWGEEAEQSIVREMKEELDVKFTPSKLLFAITDWYPFRGLNISVVNLYFAGTMTETPKQDDDVAGIGWFGLDELPENIAFGHIRQAFTALRQEQKGHAS